MSFVLIYDIPQREAVEKVRINRMLHRLGAKMVQQSLWRLGDMKGLMAIGMKIRELGGRAEILEERFLF